MLMVVENSTTSPSRLHHPPHPHHLLSQVKGHWGDMEFPGQLPSGATIPNSAVGRSMSNYAAKSQFLTSSNQCTNVSPINTKPDLLNLIDNLIDDQPHSSEMATNSTDTLSTPPNLNFDSFLDELLTPEEFASMNLVNGLTNINYDFDISDASAGNSVTDDIHKGVSLNEFDALLNDSDKCSPIESEATNLMDDGESLAFFCWNFSTFTHASFMPSTGPGRNKSGTGLKILWIPGRKKHHDKGVYKPTSCNIEHKYAERKNERWSLGGSKAHDDIVGGGDKDDKLDLINPTTPSTTVLPNASMGVAAVSVDSCSESEQEIKWLATTQFESTDARHGSPCYEEPAKRANFTISIRHGELYNAISNMPVNGSPIVNGDGTITTTFLPTPPTPTYLIAYVVSDFLQRNNSNNAASFPHATFARPNGIHGAEFSVEVGELILKAFDDYLTIPFSYALPKMDQTAIPDLAAGAMENWGLVTYREPYLLLFGNSTFTTKTNIVTIVAHEFALQWFGNLVTPAWWTYIWLNGGFATLFEYYATDWVYPEWKILDVFVYETLQAVFQNDARIEKRPMTHYVDNPDDISNLFDSIAYSKSGSVLRMMLHALTENTFKKGLILYLRAKEYSFAVEEDLFTGLQQAAREDRTIADSLSVEQIMLTWTRQKGFRLVNIQRNYETGDIILRQEKYLTVPPSVMDPDLWWIPYNFAIANEPDFLNTSTEGWIPPTRMSTVSQTTNKTWSSDDWIVFNKQQTGYYRVMYDERNYNLIVKQLIEDFSKIHLTSRSQLIDDAFDFARTGRLNYGIAFSLVSHLEHETEYVPWGSALRHLSLVRRMLAGSSQYAQFENFTRILIKHLYNHVGLADKGDDEPHLQKQARYFAINWACNMEMEECLTDTTSAIRQSLSNIHVNVRGTILCNGLRRANNVDYIHIINMLKAATDPAERNRIISSLGCSSNRTHLWDFINSSDASSEEDIYTSSAEKYRVFTSVLENGQLGLEVAIEFLQNDLSPVSSAYGANNINNALINIASYIVTNSTENEFASVLEPARTIPAIQESTIIRAFEILAENKVWLSAYESPIEAWITNFHETRNDNSDASTFVVSALLIAIVVITKVL